MGNDPMQIPMSQGWCRQVIDRLFPFQESERRDQRLVEKFEFMNHPIHIGSFWDIYNILQLAGMATGLLPKTK